MMSSREKNMVKVLVTDSTIVFFDRQFGALETGILQPVLQASSHNHDELRQSLQASLTFVMCCFLYLITVASLPAVRFKDLCFLDVCHSLVLVDVLLCADDVHVESV